MEATGAGPIFAQWLDPAVADVVWSRVAAVLAINRLCAPGSELGIEQRWYPTTVLEDLLGIEEGKINDTRLYRCLDRLLPHKKGLEQRLKQRYGELFGAEFDVLLYDLTSSYVEGAAERARRVQASPLHKALAEVVAAAEEGLESTRNLQARFGKARPLGDRAVGHLDPGALSFTLLLRHLSRLLNRVEE